MISAVGRMERLVKSWVFLVILGPHQCPYDAPFCTSRYIVKLDLATTMSQCMMYAIPPWSGTGNHPPLQLSLLELAEYLFQG